MVHANHGFATIDLPVSQGSIRIEYAPFPDLKSDAEGCTSGENMRRKLASAFKCLTVNDMADHKVSPPAGQRPDQRTNEYTLTLTSGSILLRRCEQRCGVIRSMRSGGEWLGDNRERPREDEAWHPAQRSVLFSAATSA